MDLTTLVQSLTALGSVVAAILAWAAKLQWSKEFKEAKNAQIRTLNNEIDTIKISHEEILKSKDEQIVTINEKLKLLQELNSSKVKEFFEYTKVRLEEYNDALSARVQELEEGIQDKEQLIETLSNDEAKNKEKIQKLESQKQELSVKLSSTEIERKKFEESLERSNDKIQVDDVSPESQEDSPENNSGSSSALDTAVSLATNPVSLAVLGFGAAHLLGVGQSVNVKSEGDTQTDNT